MYVIKLNKLETIFHSAILKELDLLCSYIVIYGDITTSHLNMVVIIFYITRSGSPHTMFIWELFLGVVVVVVNDYNIATWVFLLGDKRKTFNCLVNF